MAMQAMAAMESAAILYGAVTQPSEKKMSEVMSSVATVMPEMGFEELPTSPVSRGRTVTHKNPSTRELRIPPAPMVSAMRVPMMYPTPSSSGPTSSEMFPPSYALPKIFSGMSLKNPSPL